MSLMLKQLQKREVAAFKFICFPCNLDILSPSKVSRINCCIAKYMFSEFPCVLWFVVTSNIGEIIFMYFECLTGEASLLELRRMPCKL